MYPFSVSWKEWDLKSQYPLHGKLNKWGSTNVLNVRLLVWYLLQVNIFEKQLFQEFIPTFMPTFQTFFKKGMI